MLAADLSPAGPGTSFQTVETDVFSARCGGFPSCHLKAPYAGNLNLSSGSAFQSLVGVAASIDASKIRVVAGNPANSFLVQKLTNQLPTGGQDGSPMPQNEGLPWTELPQNLIDEVESWISAGALNN
jgi:hypothetical protein